MTVSERIEQLKAEALSAVSSSVSTADLEDVRVRFLGRSAELTEIKKSIGSLLPEERKEVGRSSNLASREIEAALGSRTKEVAVREREERLEAEAVDITLPGVPFQRGHLHPSQIVIDDVVDFFVGLGYRVAEGPEVETDYYNFTALGIPPGHPARTMQDTFFVDDGLVLRTQTSPMQIRTMLAQEPPVYVVCPGRTYRRDSDPTHTPMFHQVEGLAVDRGLTLGHLKGTLAAMARYVFGDDVEIRLRPSYFQYTEPSVELDVSCFVCGGTDPGCKVCKGAGWLEMLGAGMVDPGVLEEVGYDPEEYTGYAFGMGPDRMAMVKYDVPDLRLFFEGDLFSLRSQEIDGVYNLGVTEGEVLVGEVLEFGPHPDADRLHVGKVDLGGSEVQIVAGAPNPYPGARVPVVLPGSVMADGTKLRKAKLRGLESYGMMMSERELGISADHDGILLLDEAHLVGRPVADYFPVGETVLDIDVTPNRPDLWGMIGVARELAAILQTNYRVPEISYETDGEPTGTYGLRVE